MKVLCTICARGNSKGVPSKNMRELLGQPLIVYTIKQAIACENIDRVVVSTDSKQIASLAKEYNAEVPFMRPLELAQDNSSKLPVIQHALSYYIEQLNYKPDYVIDLDPTSPLRNNDDIKRCLDLIINHKDCDSVITGYRSNKNPYFNMLEINEQGYARICKNPEYKITRRQDAPTVFAMNASIYAWKAEILLNQTDLLSGRVKFLEMPEERSIDIDNEVDFKLVEVLLRVRSRDDIPE